MTIDAKELREAIAMFRKEVVPASRLFGLIADAAEAHLASLPREVPVEVAFEKRENSLVITGWYAGEKLPDGFTFQLTGTALLPREKD